MTVPQPSSLAENATSPQAAPYVIRPYTPEDIPAVLELARASLGNAGAVRKSEAFWQWKHHANPFGASLGAGAWTPEGKLVGIRLFLRWALVHPQGARLAAVRAVDTATHADYRRLGIFSRLTRQMLAILPDHGVAAIFNTPNSQSLPGYLKMGWQVAAEWPLYLHPLRPLRMARRGLGMGLPNPEGAAEGLGRLRIWSDFWEGYGDQAGALVAASEAGRVACGWRTPRTLDYLTWRYGRHPSIQYGVYTLADARDAKRLLGFAVVRPNVRQRWQELVLADLFLAEWDERLATRLLRGLHHSVAADYVIAHYAEGSRERSLLRRMGYWRIPRRRLLFAVMPLQPLSSSPASPLSSLLTDTRQWDLSLGDLELF